MTYFSLHLYLDNITVRNFELSTIDNEPTEAVSTTEFSIAKTTQTTNMTSNTSKTDDEVETKQKENETISTPPNTMTIKNYILGKENNTK